MALLRMTLTMSWPTCEVKQRLNISRETFNIAHNMWHGAPSYWNRMSSTSISSISYQKKLVIMRLARSPLTFSFWPSSFPKLSPIATPVHNAHYRGTFSACIGVSCIMRGFSSPQMRQFWLLTYPEIRKSEEIFAVHGLWPLVIRLAEFYTDVEANIYEKSETMLPVFSNFCSLLRTVRSVERLN